MERTQLFVEPKFNVALSNEGASLFAVLCAVAFIADIYVPAKNLKMVYNHDGRFS